MKMNLKKPSTVEEFRLVTRFESLRRTLLEPRYADRLDKPVAYWALASDRRLPLAFLGLPLGELLDRPFPELLATPGIGQKKLASLLTLLERATQELPPGAAIAAEPVAAAPAAEPETRFDPENASEALWVEWREAVKQHGLEGLKLGRLAPTLQALPTVIWNTPLGAYADLTLAEIRQLKTHGEKRVRVVLEVFSLVYRSLSGMSGSAAAGHLSVRLEPRFIQPLEQWILQALGEFAALSREQIRQALALPMLAQIENDLGPSVAQLAAGRLGIDGPTQSVRSQAEAMNVTRARVYQLFEDCAKVMHVRWPEGEWLFTALEEKLRRDEAEGEALRLFRALRELFYPRALDMPHAEPAAEASQPLAVLA